MTPHLRHRALLHLGQHNQYPFWANDSDKAHLNQYVSPLGGDRYQLNKSGWAVLVMVTA